MANFTHTHVEKHLILVKEKLPDKIPADAIKHKKMDTDCSKQVMF